MPVDVGVTAEQGAFDPKRRTPAAKVTVLTYLHGVRDGQPSPRSRRRATILI